MEIKMKVAVPVLLIIAIIAYGAYDLAQSMHDKKFLEVEARMGDGSVVDITDEALHATVGEAYGIEEIRFTINVKNTGEVPLTVTLGSSSPTALSNSLLGALPKQATSGNTVSWTTTWISVTPFVGTTPTFDVTASAVDSIGRSITKSDGISFAIMPDPNMGIDVSITSSSSESSSTDPTSDPDPETCTDECTIIGLQCVGGDVYNCMGGADGCTDLVFVEDCGTNECTSGACIEQVSGPISVTRVLPSSVYINTDFTVSLVVNVDETDKPPQYVITEYIPTGYVPMHVGYGQYDATHKTITWTVIENEYFGTHVEDTTWTYLLQANTQTPNPFSGSIAVGTDYYTVGGSTSTSVI